LPWFDNRLRGNPADMTDRGMADDSSEQVPGQQSNESSRGDTLKDKSSATEGLGHGPHAGEGNSSD